MDRDVKYITQLAKRDLEEIADAANAYGGDGVSVDHTRDGLEIKIDKGQLERWIRVVMSGGHLI